MFVACGIWCLADVSSVSPSSEQTRAIVFGQSSCIRTKVVVFGQNGCIQAKMVVFGKR